MTASGGLAGRRIVLGLWGEGKRHPSTREEEWPEEASERKGEARETILGGEVGRGKLHSSSTLWGRRQRMRGARWGSKA